MERRRSFANVPQLSSTPLKIIVGKDECERTFYVHEEQVTKFSQVIAAAVTGGFKEAEERTVKFPEDDPELFNIFAGFLYSGAVHCSKPDDRTAPTQDAEAGRLSQLWVLGEKLQAAEFKDAVVDVFLEKMRSTRRVPTQLYKGIYAGSVGPCGMRRLCVDIAIWHWEKGIMASAERDKDFEHFFFDMASKLHGLYNHGAGHGAPSPVIGGSACLYHDHGSEKACYKSMFG